MMRQKNVRVVQNAFNETEAGIYTGMSRSFLAQSRMDRFKREGRTPGPPYLKVGGRILYLKEDLDNWLREHRVEVE